MSARESQGGGPPIKTWHALAVSWSVVTIVLAAPAFQMLDANRLFLPISLSDLVFFVFAFQAVPTGIIFGADRLLAWQVGRDPRAEAVRFILWRLLFSIVFASLILEVRVLLIQLWGLNIPSVISIAIVLATGIVSIWLVWNAFREIQTWVTYLVLPATLLLVVPLWSLAVSTAETRSVDQVGTGPSRAVMNESVGAIFIVILDGMNFDVITKDDLIVSETFPNLRSLAADGLWFTDATTNSLSTGQSIPSLLTSVVSSEAVRAETGLPIEDFKSRNLIRLIDSGAGITIYQNFFNDCFVEAFRKCSLSSSKYPWDNISGTNPWDRLPGISLLIFQRRLGSYGKRIVDELDQRGLLPVQPGLFERPQTIPSLVSDLNSQDRSEIENGVYYVHSPLPHPPYVYDATGQLVNRVNHKWGEGGDFDAIYDNYRTQAAFADRRVGELITILKEKGVYDNAAIVITSDHGIRPDLGEMDDLQAQVPLIFKVPGVEPGVIEVEYQHIDFLPTFLDLLGIEAPSDIEGRSAVAPEAANNPRPKLIYEWSEPVYERSVESGEWRSLSP